MDGVLRKVAPEGSIAVSGGEFGRSVSSTDSPFTGGDRQSENLHIESLAQPLIDRYHALLMKEPAHIEACLAVLSLLDGMVKFCAESAMTVGKGETGLKDTFSSLGAEKGIILAATDLYKYCKSFLVSSLGGEHAEDMPTGLLLEEIGNVLSWFQTRQMSLQLSGERYRLGDENFFGLKISHDVERHHRYGLTLHGGINLDSRGNDELWMSVKLYYQSAVIYSSPERPLGTNGERKIGRLIVDRFEEFIDYNTIEWPSDVRGKVATVAAVVSVIDRSGKVCFSSRLVEPCRVISQDMQQTLIGAGEYGWSDGLLKGHRIDNLSIDNTAAQVKISVDCTVLNYPGQTVVLAMKIFNSGEEPIAVEEFALHCSTRIARFYDIQSSISDPQIAVQAKRAEILLTNEQNKILCATSAVV